MPGPSQLVLLGHVSAAHGLRGEVLIKSHTGDPAAIGSYGPLVDETGRRQFDLEVVRVTEKGVIARVRGVSDRTTAERLKGTTLHLPRDKLPAAAVGEYYHADLIGLAAVSEQGEKIGDVVAVQNFGASDLLEIRLVASRATELIPFTDDFVPEVAVAAGHVVVRMAQLVDDDGDRVGPEGAAVQRPPPRDRGTSS